MNTSVEDKNKFILIRNEKKTIYIRKDAVLSFDLTIDPGLSFEEKESRNSDVYRKYVKAAPESFSELVIYTSILDQRDEIPINVIEGRPYSKKYIFRREGIEQAAELEDLMSKLYEFIG